MSSHRGEGSALLPDQIQDPSLHKCQNDTSPPVTRCCPNLIITIHESAHFHTTEPVSHSLPSLVSCSLLQNIRACRSCNSIHMDSGDSAGRKKDHENVRTPSGFCFFHFILVRALPEPPEEKVARIPHRASLTDQFALPALPKKSATVCRSTYTHSFTSATRTYLRLSLGTSGMSLLVRY